MKNAKAAGSARERAYAGRLEADGWTVTRSPASLGAADLIALKAGQQPLVIQVKANHGSPWMNFRPTERTELARIARIAGAVAQLVHWAPFAQPRVYLAHEWPPWGGT